MIVIDEGGKRISISIKGSISGVAAKKILISTDEIGKLNAENDGESFLDLLQSGLITHLSPGGEIIISDIQPASIKFVNGEEIILENIKVHTDSFQQISDKSDAFAIAMGGVPAIKDDSIKEKFDKFREEAKRLHPYIVPKEDIPSFHDHIEKMVSSGELSKEAYELLVSKDESIIENAVDANKTFEDSLGQIHSNNMDNSSHEKHHASKDDSIVENGIVSDIIERQDGEPALYLMKKQNRRNLIKRMERETGRRRLDKISGLQNANYGKVMAIDDMRYNVSWTKFWYDRWLFSERIERIIEFREGMRQYATYIINNR